MKNSPTPPPSRASPPPLAGERITEITNKVRVEALTDTPGALARITATLSRGDMINRNGNLYPTAVLKAAVPAANEQAEEGALIGLMDHPDWFEGNKGTPSKTVLKWEKVWMDGDDLDAQALILDTAMGRDLFAQHLAGVKIPLSTNALVWGAYRAAKDVGVEWDGDEDDLIFVAERMELLTTDVVNDPSNVHARINREARERRERKEHDMTAEERATQLETQLAEETAAREAAEKAAKTAQEAQAKAEAALVAAERRHVVEATLAGRTVPQAVRDAMMAAATTAENLDAATAAVKALADAYGQSGGNGNNHIPADNKPVADALTEARRQIGVLL